MVTAVLLQMAAISVVAVLAGAMLVREAIRVRRLRATAPHELAYPRWAVVMAWVLGIELALVGAASAILALCALLMWGTIAFNG